MPDRKSNATLKRWATTIAASISILVSASAISAEIPYIPVDGASPVPIAEAAGLRSAEELETFIDGVMADQLSSHNLAGATVAVVKDGALFFVKGYGYSNIESQTAMDGKTALMRPGSVSKLLTWTALMQLVERGLVDLDTDVNQYLKAFKLPETFAQPITPRNLLTHTAGLEDGGLGYLIATDVEDLKPMAEFLQEHMPARVRPPTSDFSKGENAAYSNWGTALAGVIIEDVTGIPFDEYIEKYIFEPLGMQHSTFAEPLPADLAKNMATGYSHKKGRLNPEDFELIHNFGPAGSLSATAPDMAKFMIAHLQNGRYGDARILTAKTAKLMHSRQLSPNPHVNGTGLGFFETWINGRRLISHAGDLSQFHSDLHLLKDQDVGLWVSYNSSSSLPISSREHLLQAFMDRYYPANLPQLTAPDDFLERASEYAGTYRMTRMSFTKNEKLFYTLGGMKVMPTEDNTLLISGMLGGALSQWIEIAPDTFRRVDRDTTIAFMRNAAGAVSHISIPIAFMAGAKLGWYDQIQFHGFLLVLALIAAIGAVVGAIRHRRDPLAGPRRARWLAAITGIVFIVAIISMVMCFLSLAEDPIAGYPDWFNSVLTVILLGAALSLAVTVSAIQVWRAGWFNRATRIRYSLIAIAFLGLVISLNYFNLVGYHFG
jgi:CubicO group peptidase (beta-lactamase class C family)